MSIIDSFDESRPLISPESFYTPGNIAQKCIVTFSCKVLENILENYECQKEAHVGTANGDVPVYSLIQEGEKILFYMSPVGSAVAGAMMDEIRCVTGVRHFVVFGSCGSLNQEATAGKIIVPIESYRDEGFSYHFAKASDYIQMKNSARLAAILEKSGIPYVTGRNWTTDALYRETERNVARRKADGCISVEMESAGLQALCNHRDLELYTFFFASDLVDGSTWQNVNLGTEEEKKEQINCFEIALKIVSEITFVEA